MGFPLVIGAGVWAYRGISAYRAYRAAKLAAMVGTAGVGAVAVQNTLEQTRENARTREGATTDYCSTCSDPKCRDQGEKIRKRRDELQKRHDEMREDTNDLYNKHKTIAEAHPTLGSWDGHVLQFLDKQKNLRKLIQQYNQLDGCPKLESDHWHQASRKPPTKPAPK